MVLLLTGSFLRADTLAPMIDSTRASDHVVRYDSADISIKRPSPDREQSVFSDPKLHYRQTTEQHPGIMQAFLEWLSEKLFGKASYDNQILARKIVYWTLAIICLVIMILLLRRSQLTGLIKTKSKTTTFSFNDITEELGTIDFEKRIRTAEQEKDLRGATRWKYLHILYLLDQKGHIGFANYKTNINYLHELKTASLREGFTELSKIYDYVWYGEFKLTETTYSEHSSYFLKFIQHLHV